MAKKKYIKDSKGVTVSVTTDTLGLEKPLLNENYDIEVHNRNMDKIDEDLTPIDDSYIIELFQHDGDISRPKDYYTKEESDEKYATKEEVESNTNLANQALDKANEAFQRGDNVKTQLVDKLISEGLDVSTNNTFEELIGNIALGKKWASGKFTPTYSDSGNNGLLSYIQGKSDGYNGGPIIIENIAFKPSCFIAYKIRGLYLDFSIAHFDGVSTLFLTGWALDANGTTTNDFLKIFRENEFAYLKDGSVKVPAYFYSNSVGEYNWVAIE